MREVVLNEIVSHNQLNGMETNSGKTDNFSLHYLINL